MATQESMAIRINTALDEIEGAVKTLKKEDFEALPRSMQDRDMLRVVQFEAIARWLTDLAGSESVRKDVAEMFEQRMAELARDSGIPENAPTMVKTETKTPLKGKPRKS